MFKIMKFFVSGFMCHFLYRVKYENIEELNKHQRCLICPNHLSIFDPFFIFPKTDNMYIMAKSDIFKFKLFAKILEHYNVFSIDRNKKDVKGSMKAVNIFENNENAKLLMFPEGGIIKDEEKGKKYKTGAVKIAGMEEVPIIPVQIIGKKRIFSEIIVKVREPIYVDKKTIKIKENLEKVIRGLIDTLYEM